MYIALIGLFHLKCNTCTKCIYLYEHIRGTLTDNNDLTHTLQSWYDERLEWNPASYGGLKKIYLTAKKIWLPDFAIIK